MKDYSEMTDAERDVWREEREEYELKERMGDEP